MDEQTQKILAVETSGRYCGTAVAEIRDGVCKVRGEDRSDAEFRHSELLKSSCERLLDQCGWKKEELSLLAVSTGPGSFTGIRIGVSFMRALAQGLSLPLIGVPVFEVIASGVRSTVPLWVLIDSIGNEVFEGIFKPGDPIPSRPYRVSKIEDVLEHFPKTGRISAAGDGAEHHRGSISKKLGGRLVELPAHISAPRAGVLAELAARKFEKTPDPDYKKIVPFYLRPPLVIERSKGTKQ